VSEHRFDGTGRAPQFQRCMVLAGGGFRFGIYLGMYAAACEAGRPPDLLLASCGGSMAAALIQTLPDDAQRLAWLCSRPMHDFWRSLQASPRARLSSTLAGALRRKASSARVPRIPDLFNDYLFEVPPELPLPPASSGTTGPSVAIMGARLLFGRDEVLQPRAGRKLLEPTLFCDARAAALLQAAPSPFGHPRWGDHAIAPRLATHSGMPLADAVCISIADCFFFPCHTYQGQHYSGGMVDLFPIETAHLLAAEVMMEFKQSFDQFASIPAWRAVLGIDGNQRLRQVHGQHAHCWVDTSDVELALPQEPVQKVLDWRRNRIALVAAADHASYVRLMQAQWDYGYARGREAWQRAQPSDNAAMRRIDRHNRPTP
jgi:predicted acylesterase/phospholipase RssA